MGFLTLISWDPKSPISLTTEDPLSSKLGIREPKSLAIEDSLSSLGFSITISSEPKSPFSLAIEDPLSFSLEEEVPSPPKVSSPSKSSPSNNSRAVFLLFLPFLYVIDKSSSLISPSSILETYFSDEVSISGKTISSVSSLEHNFFISLEG